MLLAGCTDRNKPEPVALDLSTVGYGRDFRLQEVVTGQWRTIADYRDRFVMLIFGFTQCPDVCPAALTRAVEVLRLLGEDAGRIQVLFASLDPERDTPPILRSYLATFDPGFVGLRGDVEQTRETADEYRVFYIKVPIAGSYTIDHTALVYVHDTRGRLRLGLRPTLSARAQADAVRALMHPPASPAA